MSLSGSLERMVTRCGPGSSALVSPKATVCSPTLLVFSLRAMLAGLYQDSRVRGPRTGLLGSTTQAATRCGLASLERTIQGLTREQLLSPPRSPVIPEESTSAEQQMGPLQARIVQASSTPLSPSFLSGKSLLKASQLQLSSQPGIRIPCL